MATNQDVTFNLGEDWLLAVTVRDNAGSVIQDALNAAKFSVGKLGAAPLLSLTLGSGVEALGTPGVYQVIVPPASQDAFSSGVYQYEFWATLNDGTITLQNKGRLVLLGTLDP